MPDGVSGELCDWSEPRFISIPAFFITFTTDFSRVFASFSFGGCCLLDLAGQYNDARFVPTKNDLMYY